MSYKKYTGNDKYHIRVYKASIGHPFIVVTVKEETKNGKIFISGYMITHSLDRVLNKPGSYIALTINPNPNDDRPSYVNIYKLKNLPSKKFSKPYTNWHLSKEDELQIDELENEKN